MGRKEKQNTKAIEEERDQDNFNGASTPPLVFSSDDDEANQDLSLKIIKKAMRMRTAKHAPNDDVSSPFSQKPDLALPPSGGVSDGPSAIADSEVMEKKKTAKLKVEAGDQSVVIAEEQEMEETINATENHVEGRPEIGDNMVLRKLLVQDCFICKKGGHRAKDCPEKHTSTSKSIAICLKCGNSGHDIFSCRNDYSQDDLKEIQCYVCKRLGHLCCVNTDDATAGEISCYKCGQLGHMGLACLRLQDEIASGATPSSCFKCGEEGHFARECTSSINFPPQSGKGNWESSRTKDKRSQKENRYMGNRSAPNDISGARRKKRSPTEERGFSTPKKSKSRGGWMAEYPTKERGFTTPKKSKSRGGCTTEHPSEQQDYATPKKSKSRGGWTSEHPEEFFPPLSSRSKGYRSPGTPSSRNDRIHSFGGGSHTPSYKSSKVWNGHTGTSMSQGSARSNHHRYSASRFGNSSSDGHGRNYNWW
ncbi:DNA-binding protein HEXBP [Glycine soja]